MEENREIEIDLRKIFAMLKKKAVYIVLIALIGAILSGCITNFFITPQYTATTQLHVYNSNNNRLGTDGNISSSEIDASEKLVNTYLVVVESNAFLEKVADKLNNNITAAQLKKMINCSQIEETFAFQVRVTTSDPQLSMDIANAIADTCPDEIVRLLKVGGVSVIDYATKPINPSSPNLEKNIFIGLVIFFAASFCFFFIKELFDTSINDEKDLEREFEIPVLGTIPKLTPVSEKLKVSGTEDAAESQPQSAVDITKFSTGDEE